MNTWEQQENESAKAYKAFATYRDLGADRSIDRSYTKLYSKQRQNTDNTASKRAPRHWQDWSVTFEWVARAEEWDAEQQRIADDIRKRATQQRIAKLIEDEFADYEAELQRFQRVRDLTPIYERRSEKEFVEEKKDPSTGIITRTVNHVWTTELDISEHKLLTEWRLRVSELGRRNLGLPREVTASKVDANVHQVLTWKDAVEQARNGSKSEDDSEEDTDAD